MNIIDLMLRVALVACVIGMMVCVIMLIRSSRVHAYRLRVIDKIYVTRSKEIDSGLKEHTLDWDILAKVDYDDMVIRLWRSLDSFFPPEYRP